MARVKARRGPRRPRPTEPVGQQRTGPQQAPGFPRVALPETFPVGDPELYQASGGLLVPADSPTFPALAIVLGLPPRGPEGWTL